MEALSNHNMSGNTPIAYMTYGELNTLGWNAFLEADDATLAAVLEEVHQRAETYGNNELRALYANLSNSLSHDIDKLHEGRVDNG